jgi:hypothetical protein
LKKEVCREDVGDGKRLMKGIEVGRVDVFARREIEIIDKRPLLSGRELRHA